jgi:hypothetical protein
MRDFPLHRVTLVTNACLFLLLLNTSARQQLSHHAGGHPSTAVGASLSLALPGFSGRSLPHRTSRQPRVPSIVSVEGCPAVLGDLVDKASYRLRGIRWRLIQDTTHVGVLGRGRLAAMRVINGQCESGISVLTVNAEKR